MKKWTTLAEATTPDGKTLSLMERDGQYAIRLGGLDLMSNREVESEKQLAIWGCKKAKANCQVLIGGLGMGFTLKAVLEILPQQATVTVAELIPAVANWNRDPRYPFAGKALTDRRVKLVVGDVTKQLGPNRFDIILLDVDNGPRALTTASNEGLYGDQGVLKIANALKPGGRVVIWSVDEDKAFLKRLAHHGLQSSTERVTSREAGGGQRTLFIGDKGKKKKIK